jgi:pimeloyl-ACP methyl ester carboxylesterase
MAAPIPALPPALEAECRSLHGEAGPLTYYEAEGPGPPVVLIHSINAAASAYEVKPIFDGLRGRAHVLAIDLPGFGRSDRSDRRYDVQLYTQALRDLLQRLEQERPGPVHALAVSLASEFLARAAREQPDRFRTLAFVTPTGFNRGSHRLRSPGTREIPGFFPLLAAMPWRQWLYDRLTSEASIRYFLRRTYGSPDIDEGMVAYDYLTCRQPGARHAPFAFLSGRLFSTDIRAIYEELDGPIWMPHGTRATSRTSGEPTGPAARTSGRWRPTTRGRWSTSNSPNAS